MFNSLGPAGVALVAFIGVTASLAASHALGRAAARLGGLRGRRADYEACNR